MGKILFYKISKINDAIITDPKDELFDLQEKYNVKISRSNSSDAVYVFRNRDDIIRIGHSIPKGKSHIWNFNKDKSVFTDKVTKQLVEETIKKNFN